VASPPRVARSSECARQAATAAASSTASELASLRAPSPASPDPGALVGVTGQGAWIVLVPVKELGAAKTRLAVPHRERVALAMAVDTVSAAAAATLVRAVVVITDDPRALAALALAGAPGTPVTVLPDAPRAGLNPALRHAAEVAAARFPDAGLAALAGDLPALRPAELDRALAAAAAVGGRAFVADAAGAGTVLLCATSGVGLGPAFGRDSRDAHAGSGASDLTSALGTEVAGLRRDVDTPSDLWAAAALGLGPQARQATTPDQATVRRWSVGTGGDAVRDDGSLVELPPDAVTAAGPRLLRPGQRVRLESDGGRVRRVTLLTL